MRMIEKRLFIAMLMVVMTALTIASASATLNVEIEDIITHPIGENLTINPYVYDENGVSVTSPNCTYTLDDLETTNPLTNLSAGDHELRVYCHNTTAGGVATDTFEVVRVTPFGLWTEPSDWTFPIIYLVLTILLITLALLYTSSIMGVLGSLMLVFSYFMVGATAPLLFTPLLIVGLLLTFRFATL